MADQKLTALSTVTTPALTDLWYIVQGSTSYKGTIDQYRKVLTYHDIAGAALTQPSDGDTLERFAVNRPFTIATSLASSIVVCEVTASATTTYDFLHNGSTFATMVFDTSTLTANFSGGPKSFIVGDIFEIYVSVADDAQDGLAWTIAGVYD